MQREGNRQITEKQQVLFAQITIASAKNAGLQGLEVILLGRQADPRRT